MTPSPARPWTRWARRSATRVTLLIAALALHGCIDPSSISEPQARRVDWIDVSSPVQQAVVGQEVQLTATAHDSRGQVLTGKTFAWSTFPSTGATVSSTGVFRATESDVYLISADVEGKTGATSLLVVPATSTPTPTPTAPSAGTGQVAFWTASSSVLPISVSFAGQSGQVTSAFTSSPSCGQAGAFTVTLPAGTYAVAGSGADGSKWSGNVTVQAGVCLKMQFTTSTGGSGSGGGSSGGGSSGGGSSGGGSSSGAGVPIGTVHIRVERPSGQCESVAPSSGPASTRIPRVFLGTLGGMSWHQSSGGGGTWVGNFPVRSANPAPNINDSRQYFDYTITNTDKVSWDLWPDRPSGWPTSCNRKGEVKITYDGEVRYVTIDW